MYYVLFLFTNYHIDDKNMLSLCLFLLHDNQIYHMNIQHQHACLHHDASNVLFMFALWSHQSQRMCYIFMLACLMMFLFAFYCSLIISFITWIQNNFMLFYIMLFQMCYVFYILHLELIHCSYWSCLLHIFFWHMFFNNLSWVC